MAAARSTRCISRHTSRINPFPSSPWEARRDVTLNLLQAVCCSDHQRCCPAGTQCDLEHDACVSGAAPVPMLEIAAVPSEGTCLFFPKIQTRCSQTDSETETDANEES